MTLKWVWNDALSTLPQRHPTLISLYKADQVYNSKARVPSDEVKVASPARLQQLVRAHDLEYVKGVMKGTEPNGFGNFEPSIADHALYSTGIMIKAVQEALDEPEKVVCAPVSGFHHAHYAEAEGYCTFNGLLVAVAVARLRRRVPSVLIIDGDAHYGNGTDDILTRLAIDGVRNLTHHSKRWDVLDSDTWEAQIAGQLANAHWDLVLYQAGADAHAEDPYGEGYLSDYDWEARDRLVFQYCAKRGFPLVFNLAGGYNKERTVDLHCKTVNTARDVYRNAAHLSQPQDAE